MDDFLALLHLFVFLGSEFIKLYFFIPQYLLRFLVFFVHLPSVACRLAGRSIVVFGRETQGSAMCIH